jgi:hypothetical protein
LTIGADSAVVNGQLVTLPSSYAYNPQGWGPQTRGVPQVTPSYPPYVGGALQSAPGSESVGGYGTAGNNALATAIAGSAPWSFKMSPVIFATVGLVVSLVLLKAIHWRETMLEGDESARIGPVSERAEAAA